MNLNFKTKAQNLNDLSQHLKTAKVLPVYFLTVKSWREDSANLLEEIRSKFKNQKIVVRSSALNEDSELSSMAGHYTSILNVNPNEGLESAVEAVIESFGKEPNPLDEVLIQPMLSDVQVSGVAFTRDISTNSHYFVINYDDKTGLTDTVTGGAESNFLKTLYISKTTKLERLKDWHKDLVISLNELEQMYESSSIDVEFGISDNELFIFQVRPLLVGVENELTLETQRIYIRQIKNKVNSLAKKFPYLSGDKSIFGVMPDWNPAEIIGIRPRPLALSLYKELITDGVWAESRDRYGYKNLRSFPLIISFAGMPYVDVRVSFNSFIPDDLDDKLANKLVNYYLEELKENPNNHDKVEFNIIQSCYTFNTSKHLNELRHKGFSENEIKQIDTSLKGLTNNIINSKNGLWKVDFKSLKELQRRQDQILNSDLNEIEKVYWLIEDCKRYGSLPFAGLARAGFVAIQMLKTMVTEKLIDKEDYVKFLNSLTTVSSQMSEDLGKLSKEKFLELYGHLRPGTYDIMTKSYAEDPDNYFKWEDLSETKHIKSDFKLDDKKMVKIDSELHELGINHSAKSLFKFLKSAIEGREYAKFLFTKNISESMILLRGLGKKFGYSRDDISYMDIGIIKDLYSSTNKFSSTINWSIDKGKKIYFKVTKNIILPPLILDGQDAEYFELPQNEPNFITMKKTSSNVVTHENKSKLDGNILLIPSADPGFDWIFTFKIKGFITMYGGANSHMAIRASELGIPAVIGAGELLYSRWSQAKHLTIDCLNKKVEINQ